MHPARSPFHLRVSPFPRVRSPFPISPIPLAWLSLVYYPSLLTHTRVWSSRVVSVRPRWRCLGGFIGRSRRKRTKSSFLDNALSSCAVVLSRARMRAVKVTARKGSLKTWLAGWSTDSAGRCLYFYTSRRRWLQKVYFPTCPATRQTSSTMRETANFPISAILMSLRKDDE